MSTLQEKVAAAGAAYRDALKALSDGAPELFADRQEGHENFQGILARMIGETEWLDRRVTSLDKPATKGTEAGLARRKAALKAARKDKDEAAIARLQAELAEMGGGETAEDGE